MHSIKFLIVAASLAAVPAMAQDAGAPAAATVAASNVKKGAMVFAADGSRIGRIDDIRDNTVGVIYNGRYIRIPVATLSDTDRGVTTSLTRKEAGKL